MATTQPSEFLDLFWECAKKGTKYYEAYHQAETIHIKQYGHRRYAGWNSFRQILFRSTKNRL